MTALAEVEFLPGAEPASVTVHLLDDGLLVRLAGAFDDTAIPSLRRALLGSRPAGCDDVVIDAGEISAACDAALAVLVASHVWASANGGALRVSRMSAVLAETIADAGLAGVLPVLPGVVSPVS